MHYSADGRWRWDGLGWRPAQRPGVFWFIHQPGWLEPVLLMSLIGLVPVVGFFCSFGWLLAARDGLRAGDWRVPPAGFGHFRRGVNFALTAFFYCCLWLAVALALVGLDALALRGGVRVVGPDAVGMLLALLLLVVAAFFFYTFAAVLTIADERGIWATWHPQLVWRTANAAAGASWRFAGVYLLGMACLWLFALSGLGALGLLASAAVYLMTAPALTEVWVAAPREQKAQSLRPRGPRD